MISRTQVRRVGRWVRFRIPLLRRDDASQIVEFALSLPLLVVFAVGIFDFTTAYTVKQKLANAARDCARSVAGSPAGDVGNTAAPAPASVFDGSDVVANYLDNTNLNSCGIRGGVTDFGGLDLHLFGRERVPRERAHFDHQSRLCVWLGWTGEHCGHLRDIAIRLPVAV